MLYYITDFNNHHRIVAIQTFHTPVYHIFKTSQCTAFGCVNDKFICRIPAVTATGCKQTACMLAQANTVNIHLTGLHVKSLS